MRRALLVGTVIVVAVPLVAVGAASWWLNGDAIKLRLTDQVRRATGRELTIAGPVSLAWSFSPTIALNDVTLSNPPGFPQPQMAHADRVEAQIGLGALWDRRIAIDRIAIVSPTLRLERDGAGRSNWDFSPPAAPAAAPTQPAAAPGQRFAVSIGAVDITQASIVWGLQTITAPHLAYDPTSGTVTGNLVAAGQALTLSGTAGPLDKAPYPLDLHLAGAGATAGLRGTSAASTLTVQAADLAALAPLVGRPLPSIRDVTLSAAFPGPTAIQLHTGAAMVGRLALQRAELNAPSLTDPAAVTAAATIGSLPLALSGQIGSLAALLRGPSPVEARIEATGLRLTATGTLAANGVADLQLGSSIPDLAASGAEAGLAWPGLQDLEANSGLTVRPGSLAFTGLRLASAQGDLAGDLALTYTGRPTLRGALTSTRFELPAIAPAPAAAPPAPQTPSTSPAPPATPQPTRLIPDTKLPLGLLRDADADLQFTAASLRAAGLSYTNVQAHAVLANGTLRIDPAAITLGPAPAHATLQIDAAAQPPALHATIDAPGLPFGAVLAFGGGDPASAGVLDLRADLSGHGETVRQIAATLTGHAGMALVDGQIDNALLERLVGGLLGGAGFSLQGGGGTTIRCAAIRAEAESGKVQFPALALDTTKLALEGSGGVDLGTETIDLRLRPQLRMGGGLSVPIRLRGTFAAPKATLDPGAIASGRVGIVLGGPAAPDACGPALATARDGQTGVAPPAPAPTRSLKPADLLRGLLR